MRLTGAVMSIRLVINKNMAKCRSRCTLNDSLHTGALNSLQQKCADAGTLVRCCALAKCLGVLACPLLDQCCTQHIKEAGYWTRAPLSVDAKQGRQICWVGSGGGSGSGSRCLIRLSSTAGFQLEMWSPWQRKDQPVIVVSHASVYCCGVLLYCGTCVREKNMSEVGQIGNCARNFVVAKQSSVITLVTAYYHPSSVSLLCSMFFSFLTCCWPGLTIALYSTSSRSQ